MSSRRRLALVTTAVLAVLLAGVLVLVLRPRPASGPSAAAPSGAAGAVLVVPGYGGSTTAPDVLVAALRRAGRRAQVVRLAGDGTGDLRVQAGRLDRAARAAVAAGAPSVDVVGYSAGGVVVRLWLAGDALDARGSSTPVPVRRVVTLGSPHHGTDLAGQAAALGGAGGSSVCPLACQQLEPGSDLLARLPATPGAASSWTSVFSETDEVVVPPVTASALSGAVDVDLQRVCPGVRVAHGQLPTSALGVGVVDAALDGARLRAAPPSSRCGALTARGRALLR